MGTISTGGRTLHIFGALARGGAETWFLQALARRGGSPWSADICLLADQEGSCVEQARALGARILHCPYRPAATFPLRFLRLLRRERYDVVHAHVLLFSGVVLALARQAGVQTRVAHAHNSSDGRADSPLRTAYRALMRRLIASHASHVVACSREAAAALGSAGASILPYGIDLLPFTLPAAGPRTRFGIPEGAGVLGAVGRLTRQKNHRFLLDAFAAALDLRPDLRLILIGDGELRSELVSHIEQLGLTDRVLLLGLRDDVPALLAGLCDGFAMPSLHEGLPVALLEAQAAGLPCLVSSKISPEAIVLPGQVESLPLDGPWPERLAALPSRPKIDPQAAVAGMRQAGFDVARSWASLAALYEPALDCSQRTIAA